MMERWGETLLGAAVVAVAALFFTFASAQSGQSGGSRGAYELMARFQRVDGVAIGTDVRVSGVKVGVVRSVELDRETYFARLTMAIDHDVEILDDSTARIASDGLLGGAYVAIEPAGLDPIPPGGEILNTQGAVDLLTLLSSAMQGMGGGTDAEEAQP